MTGEVQFVFRVQFCSAMARFQIRAAAGGEEGNMSEDLKFQVQILQIETDRRNL